MAVVLASHTNSENERVTIERITDGQFAGQYVLCIHDDYTSKVVAPTLLDGGTRRWLIREMLYLGRDGDDLSIESGIEGVLAKYLDIYLAKKLDADRGDLASDLADLFRALMQAQGVTA